MSKKTMKGSFVPQNPSKYIGSTSNIMYRSSWELSMMLFLDKHPNVVGWSSEGLSIPYKNPLTGRWTMYIPDFLVVFVDKDGNQRCEVIEIKPLKETPTFEGRVSQQTRLVQAINAAKWQAAAIYCVKRGWNFRVATEQQLFPRGRQ